MTNDNTPRVAVIMGSQSDWPTMQNSVKLLNDLGVGNISLIISAHRTPDRLFSFASSAIDNGFEVIIAGAGGAAHLPGMVAAMTTLPVLGVPVQSKSLDGMDSLLSIVQMPGGVPVGTLAIGQAGAINAGLLAAQIVALQDLNIRERVVEWRENQSANVPLNPEGSAKS
ncbi:MAG: 5-(carboxyamino)imidazole ribonucleotide mutase [Rhodospirillaceae bacterium TMED8]|nr:5-(carboxyamino)imidazole ribonucleotide mutase [Magnetovibrio sp.]OUT53196.1 MAG: 5-(carboxyamino)imidazole ribonucleotide mutase [Rhodospirillaceae bacterium TMED8]|tara:strand:+ start:798 stop:1304 length:507 start_codon:yes stop_codon:yes gene_type:complete